MEITVREITPAVLLEAIKRLVEADPLGTAAFQGLIDNLADLQDALRTADALSTEVARHRAAFDGALDVVRNMVMEATGTGDYELVTITLKGYLFGLCGFPDGPKQPVNQRLRVWSID